MKVVHRKDLFKKPEPTWFTPVSEFFLGILSLIKFNIRKPKPNKKVRITQDDDEKMFREKFRRELAAKRELELEKQLAQGKERTKKSVERFNNNYKRKKQA